MMMTSGEAVKYKGSMDCAVKVMKTEGFMALMKGAGEWIATSLLCIPTIVVLSLFLVELPQFQIHLLKF